MIFLTSVFLGVFLPQFSDSISGLTTFFLVALMVFSLKNARFRGFGREDFRRVQWLFLTSLVSGLVLMLLSFFFVGDAEVLKGLVLWCLMPPAVSIVSMSVILRSDAGSALLAEIVSYFVYLLVTPALVFVFLRESVPVHLLAAQLLLVIVLPVIIAYFSRKVDTGKYDKLVIELSLALIFYVVIGRTSSFIWSDSSLFGFLLLISVAYRLLFFLFFRSSRMGLNDEKLFVLFATMKNTGIASVVALSFLSARALLGIGVQILLLPFILVLLELYYSRGGVK